MVRAPTFFTGTDCCAASTNGFWFQSTTNLEGLPHTKHVFNPRGKKSRQIALFSQNWVSWTHYRMGLKNNVNNRVVADWMSHSAINSSSLHSNHVMIILCSPTILLISISACRHKKQPSPSIAILFTSTKWFPARLISRTEGALNARENLS